MSVRQEENGTWTAQVWYHDYNGERRHKTKRGFETEEEALAWHDEYAVEAEGSVSSSLAAFVETYLEDIRPRIRESTYENKVYTIKSKILPYLGHMRMDEIEPVDIVRWQNRLMKATNSRGEQYSPTYLRTVNNQLTAIFNHASRLYGLKDSPCKKTQRMGSSEASEMQFWTKEEYLKFADAISDKPFSYHAFEVLYWCGLREGEMLALTPNDLDFERSLLYVRKSYRRAHGQDIITDPKTPKSVRKVQMPTFLRDELEEYVKQLGIAPDERIFTVTKHCLYHEMKRGSQLAGVKKIRVHDLRHSHVSLLIDLGFSAVAIADRLGHESADITFRYAHLFPDKQSAMADALDEMKR
ncbi:hypothetical protein HMPREF1008_00257 [Olsenella sp. oral taxon 809 str. F0356]|uniref:site-specific integrase n=1 Tax=Olsenella sp. oral taxon 809 TaxID=661086 RepID=UPI000231F0C0|nr:site-specific integrase [Olsenella sp. oral taxon 809]EHF02612.1 hypothetical protein HMPREF1008_00257 [Olsenella sp. oral taxon 809 str. F0356]